MDNDDYNQPRTQYSKITFNKRLRLIEMVDMKHYSIYKASKQLGISNSTAKLIIKNYREEGRIFQKKQQRLQSKKSQSPHQQKEEEQPAVKQEMPSKAEVKLEVSNNAFHKLLTEITQLNLRWIAIQMQKRQ